eukprot:m.195996 g.195996  ORF g.195996 m.195996 type:complete len:281 (-) comp53735_c1_seq2:170-1012(-)
MSTRAVTAQPLSSFQRPAPSRAIEIPRQPTHSHRQHESEPSASARSTPGNRSPVRHPVTGRSLSRSPSITSLNLQPSSLHSRHASVERTTGTPITGLSRPISRSHSQHSVSMLDSPSRKPCLPSVMSPVISREKYIPLAIADFRLSVPDVELVLVEDRAVHVYCIHVRLGEFQWLTRKRYSAIREFHEELGEFMPEVRKLDFPPKRIVLTVNIRSIEERRLALQGYLEGLCGVLQRDSSLRLRGDEISQDSFGCLFPFFAEDIIRMNDFELDLPAPAEDE